MNTKRFTTIFVLLVLLLALIPISAVAQSGTQKGGKPTSTPPPPEPPIPTETPDTGTLYGDLYIILRNEDGLPIFDSNGCIQPDGHYVLLQRKHRNWRWHIDHRSF